MLYKGLGNPIFRSFGPSCIAAMPKPGEFVFGTKDYDRLGLYILDCDPWNVRKIAATCRQATALAVDNQGRVWAGVQRGIICLDPATGAELKFPRRPAK